MIFTRFAVRSSGTCGIQTVGEARVLEHEGENDKHRMWHRKKQLRCVEWKVNDIKNDESRISTFIEKCLLLREVEVVSQSANRL